SRRRARRRARETARRQRADRDRRAAIRRHGWRRRPRRESRSLALPALRVPRVRICSDKRQRVCLRFVVLDALHCRALGALSSPLWGGVGGGGSAILRWWCHRDLTAPPPSPSLPHKGGGSRPSLPVSMTPALESLLSGMRFRRARRSRPRRYALA